MADISKVKLTDNTEYNIKDSTARNDISNLTTRVTTAEGNVTNLTSRVSSAESNITDLQASVANMLDVSVTSETLTFSK